MNDLANVKYTECYVAFLDILGFKNLINQNDCDCIYSIFQEILNFEPHPLIDTADVYKNIHYTIMSDSIIIYIDASITDGFIALTDVCSQIQMKLSRNDPPILIRGGISKGSLYHKDNMLFGSGLTKAYILESSAAIFPRIIFTEELRQSALENTGKFYVFDYNFMYYAKDDDEMYYIDFLHTFNYMKTIRPKTVEESLKVDNEYFCRLLKHVDDVLAKEIDLSIRKKYIWLKRKINKQIEHMPQVKTFFEDLHKREQEKADERFNNALRSKK